MSNTIEIKPNLNGYQTIQNFMDMNQVSRQTVYNWIDSEKLQVKKLLDRTLVKLKA